MPRYAIPLIAVAASAAGAAPAMAAEVQIVSQGPVVELTLTETVAADPDLATVSAGVTTIAPTAVEAMQQNNAQMNRVVDRIEQLGVDEDDIQTTGVNLNAEFDWDEATRQQRFRGYRASNRVTVKLRDIARTGRVLDALVAAGANDLSGIAWSMEDPEPPREQAREAAFRAARARAERYAALSGYTGLKLLEVSESVTQNRPMQFDIVATAASVRNESMPIRPGQVETGVTVTVKYEMTR